MQSVALAVMSVGCYAVVTGVVRNQSFNKYIKCTLGGSDRVVRMGKLQASSTGAVARSFGFRQVLGPELNGTIKRVVLS